MTIADTLSATVTEVRALEARCAHLKAENAVLRERAAIAPDLVLLHPHEHLLTGQERNVMRMLQAAAPHPLSVEVINERLPGAADRVSSDVVTVLVRRIRAKLGRGVIVTTCAGYRFGGLSET